MVHTCNYSILAEKPTFGRLHCYGAPSTAALQRHSDDCASMTEPRWHHCWLNFQFFLVASYIALGHIQTTPSREYVAEASCLADWLGQTTAPFSVAYLRTMVFLGTLCARECESLLLGIGHYRRHDGGGICKQRMTALRNSIYRYDMAWLKIEDSFAFGVLGSCRMYQSCTNGSPNSMLCDVHIQCSCPPL